jgi:small-conductance mechanosensitive channel
LLESAWAAGVFVVSVVVAWLVFISLRFVRRRLEATGTHKLLPQLLLSLNRPLSMLIVVEGIIVAVALPTALAEHRDDLTKAGIAAAIVIAGYGVGRVTAALIEWYLRSRGVRRKARIDEGLVRAMRRLVSVVSFGIAVLVLLRYFTLDITPIIAGLGVGGLAVALALQPTLSNFFAGTQIISDRVVRVGDYIELDAGTRGYVTDVGWRSTRIRTSFNNMVIIPNSRLADSIITNYYGPTMEISVMVYCGVSYEADLAQVERVALDVGQGVIDDLDESVKTAKPWFGFEEFGDSNISFWVWLQAVDRVASFRVTSELIKRLHARLGEEGITINYPVRRLVYDSPQDPPLLPGAAGQR